MLRMLLTLIWVGFSGVRLVEGGGGVVEVILFPHPKKTKTVVRIIPGT